MGGGRWRGEIEERREAGGRMGKDQVGRREGGDREGESPMSAVRRNGGGILGIGGNEAQRKLVGGGDQIRVCGSKNDKGRWGRRTREGAGYLPVRYFENTDSRLQAASFKMETAVTRSGSESTSQRLS